MTTKSPHKGRERDKVLHPAPGQGKVRIGEQSGLRKLMRAARRNKVPEERMLIIESAQISASAFAEQQQALKLELA